MKFGTFVFIVYLIFGLYFLNLSFKLINFQFPTSVSSVLLIIGGILLIIGGMKFISRKSSDQHKF